jgi:hypothetical protein
MMDETPQQPVDPMAILNDLPKLLQRLGKSEERSMRIERLLMRVALNDSMKLDDLYTKKQIAWALMNSPTE